ncbi:guanine nucleotide binding protein, alpha subunit [Mrakia frigida]|uniref:guanine nucleotide-binding protein subunit alpha n=1 Tax=Mrakia frigida TaxID=29902 RepID=UPI003FCBF1EE
MTLHSNHHHLYPLSAMGNCVSSPSKDDNDLLLKKRDARARKRTKSIETKIRADERRRGNEIKILLLGAGGSGKSTVLKVMRLLHHVPFTESEISDYRALMYRNLIEGLHLLLDLCDELEIELDPSILPIAESLSSIPHTPGYEGNDFSPLFPQEVKGDALAIWSDPGLQEVWKRSREVAVPENLPYLMANIDRFWEPDYVPSESDILHARSKTTGISETAFQVRDHKYLFVDVGGQKSERRKWLHCFDGVDAILFVVNLAGYDEVLEEDRDANQTRDALLLFQSIVSNPLFLSKTFLLFLNKTDLFDQKVASGLSPITPTFSDYPSEDEGDVLKARAFFQRKFLRLAKTRDSGVAGPPLIGSRGSNSNGMIYSHFSTAVDKSGMRVIMMAVQEVMVRQLIAEMGLLS